MQLDEIQWKTESLSLGLADDFSSWLKSYDVTLRAFKDLSKQNITSDAETQKRMEHFKKKLCSVESNLLSLTIRNALFKQYLPKNYLLSPNNPQFLHKDTVALSGSSISPVSTTTQPAQETSPSLSRFTRPQAFALPIPDLNAISNAGRARRLSPLGSPMVNLPTLFSPLSTTSNSTQPLSQRQVQPLTPPSTSSPTSLSNVFSQLLGTPTSSFPLGHPLNPPTYSTQFSSTSSAMQPTALPKSFTISKFDKNALKNQEIPDWVLGHVYYLLRTGKETEALERFDKLASYEKLQVYNTLWILRDKPMPGSPIHHENFGEVSFLNQEERCKSTSIQKACAIEITRTKSDITGTILLTLSKMILIMQKGDTVEYKKLFHRLPREIQNAIQKTHWEVCGRPMPGNPIAHDNFGRVSFLAEEKRCDVPNDTRIDTLNAVSTSMRTELLKTTYKELGSDIPAKIQEWEKIDASKVAGQAKNDAKKETLHALAKQIVPLFLPAEASIPNVFSDSYKALAAAYLEQYPFLKGYFLLLIPDLRINEVIEMDSKTPKRTQANPPNFSGLDNDAKENHRRSLHKGYIDETLHTLKAGFYVTENGNVISLNLFPATGSVYTQNQGQYGSPKVMANETKIFLYSKDCLTVAQDCIERGLNPIVLNAAHNENPGGGYKTGAGGQEESLMRRTGLSAALDTSVGAQQTNFYPINKDAPNAGLYVSNVPVFRGEEAQGCPYLEKPFETAFAVMPALNFNKELQMKSGIQNPLELEANIQGRLEMPKDFSKQSTSKLGIVFDMAQHNGHDAVVLVAWGSGAYQNPPEQICELMMNMFLYNFTRSFKEVHLCIVDDHHTGRTFNPQGNYAAYKQTIIQKFSDTIRSIPGMSFQAL